LEKSTSAFRTISEVAEELAVPKHVLRFWEGKFSQLRPMKRGGGRRYYRPEDVDLLRGIRWLLYSDGYTIKGVQKILRGSGVRFVKECWRDSGSGTQSGGMVINIPELAEEAASEARRELQAPQRTSQKRNSGTRANAPAAAESARGKAALAPEHRGALSKLLSDLEECRELLRIGMRQPSEA